MGVAIAALMVLFPENSAVILRNNGSVRAVLCVAARHVGHERIGVGVLTGSPCTCMAQALDPNKVKIFPCFIRLLQCTVAARVSLRCIPYIKGTHVAS